MKKCHFNSFKVVSVEIQRMAEDCSLIRTWMFYTEDCISEELLYSLIRMDMDIVCSLISCGLCISMSMVNSNPYTTSRPCVSGDFLYLNDLNMSVDYIKINKEGSTKGTLKKNNSNCGFTNFRFKYKPEFKMYSIKIFLSLAFHTYPIMSKSNVFIFTFF